MHNNILTVQQHILQEQRRFPGATGEFSFMFSAITLATKRIQSQVRRAGLTDILEDAGEVNVQGELKQQLDVYANEALLHHLGSRDSVGVLASEENEHAILLPHLSAAAKYAVVFDPLDGSSNIDVNVSVGTTFSIFRRPDGSTMEDPISWILQPGRKQIGAGYVVYGSSTIMVYTAMVCMDSRSTPRSAPLCSVMRTSRCRNKGFTTPSTKPIGMTSRRPTTISSSG
ncbi:MAG: fructose-1,6-bisphosphatase [Blastopirellula sp.]|nr:fructose-1,6-bisphosphatase [Blastopirellula sp.]